MDRINFLTLVIEAEPRQGVAEEDEEDVEKVEHDQGEHELVEDGWHPLLDESDDGEAVEDQTHDGQDAAGHAVDVEGYDVPRHFGRMIDAVTGDALWLVCRGFGPVILSFFLAWLNPLLSQAELFAVTVEHRWEPE